LIGREWVIVVIVTRGKALLGTSHSILQLVSTLERRAREGRRKTKEMNKERR
jgi:hypothetical protein